MRSNIRLDKGEQIRQHSAVMNLDFRHNCMCTMCMPSPKAAASPWCMESFMI